MGKGKKQKHVMRDRGINQESINRRVAALDNGEVTIPQRTTGIVSKLQSHESSLREEACLDVSAQVLDRTQHDMLRRAGAHVQLTHLINDEVLEIRQSSATALRNFCTIGGDEVIDEIIAHNNGEFLSNFGKSLLAQFEVVSTDGYNCGDTPASKTLDEMLQLVSVVVEGSEAAANAFSSERQFLALLLECLRYEYPLQASAAEVLYVISDENEMVAQFMGDELDDSQQQLLNDATSSVPHSPTLLRVSVLLSGMLLNCAPTLENVNRVLPIIVAGASTTPSKETRKLVPLLSENCEMDEDVRLQAVAQSFDRMRALQQSLDIFGNVIGLVCETNADEDDDEAALANNPHRDIITDSGMLDHIVDCVTSVLAPMDDVVMRSAIRQPCDSNADVTTMQHLYVSTEVAVLGATSALLHMLPLDRFGDRAIMWDVTVGAISDRLSLREDIPDQEQLLMLQVESLAEMCWTIQRKDEDGVTSPQQHHLDTFTRLAWEDAVSSSTRVFVIGTVGCVGQRVATPDVVFACGKFMIGMLNIDDIEVQAEAANSIMDLFCDERFDESAYKPLELQNIITDFLPHIKSAVAQMPKRSAKREHFDEIALNLKEFLKYKKQHVA